MNQVVKFERSNKKLSREQQDAIKNDRKKHRQLRDRRKTEKTWDNKDD